MEVIIPKGTQYPTEKAVCAKYIKSACEGASSLGLVVFEQSFMIRPEIIYEFQDGVMKEKKVLQRESVNLRALNPQDRDFIQANPPCHLGEKRFIAQFGVDASKRLTISLRDTTEGNRSHLQLPDGKKIPLPVNNYPMVKL